MAYEEKLGPPGVEGVRRDSTFEDHRRGSQFDPVNEGIVEEDVTKLKRNLHGRHMQMIAIGMPILTHPSRRLLTILFQVVPSVLVFSSVRVALCALVAQEAWYTLSSNS